MNAPAAQVSPPEPKTKGKAGGKKQQGGGAAVFSVAGWQPTLKQEFIGNGYEVACRLPVARPEPAPERPRGRGEGGASSRGELYAYYKRMGMLEVFFSLFPG